MKKIGLLISFVVLLIACNNKPSEQIIGKWNLVGNIQGQDEVLSTFTFQDDGTLMIETGKNKVENQYQLDGKRITIINKEKGKTVKRTATVKIKNEQMTMTFEDVSEGDPLKTLTFKKA